MNILAYVEDLVDLGYDPIPIAPGSKQPARLAWPTMPPPEQWQGAPPACNLALRHGGALRLASMEAERNRPEAIPALRRYMAGLGYDWQAYPANLTAHAGERYFFALLDAPTGSHSRKMADDLGGGELRFGPGAFALIPPSLLADGGRYEMLAGAWDGELPKLLWADVAPLLANGRRQDNATPTPPAELSAIAQALADGENVLPADMRKRLRGIGGTDYPSVDDFTTVYRLAALGYDADTVMALLLAHPGYGYFSDLAAKDGAAALHWLADAHAKATAYIAKNGSDVSQRLARLIAQAERETWPGRTGATDKAVYLAHLRIALDANTPVWAGAARRLADLVNVGRVTATRANTRLIESGKLALHTPATAQLAAEYALPTDDHALSGTLLYVGTEISGSLSASSAAEDGQDKENERDDRQRPPDSETGRVQSILGHDLFCWQGFGKACGLVYLALLDAPGTVKELAERTGRHRETVRRALVRMSAIPDSASDYALVEEDGAGVWELAGGANLDEAARRLAVDGIGAKRQAKHEAERKRHAAALEPYKAGAPIPHPSQNRGERMEPGEVTRRTRRKTWMERKRK